MDRTCSKCSKVLCTPAYRRTHEARCAGPKVSRGTSTVTENSFDVDITMHDFLNETPEFLVARMMRRPDLAEEWTRNKTLDQSLLTAMQAASDAYSANNI